MGTSLGSVASLRRLLGSAGLAALVTISWATAALAGDEPVVTLQPNTNGCNGVLPSTDGNTDMRLVGGTLQPGGTAVFEISYPVEASSVGKQFQITDCAFINGVAALKYLVEFVPSNQNYTLFMALAVPANAPVGGQYCNYAKTTGAPTAAQSSQRKAGPACFTIRAPATTAPAPAGAPPATGTPSTPAVPGSTSGTTPLLPDTATRAP